MTTSTAADTSKSTTSAGVTRLTDCSSRPPTGTEIYQGKEQIRSVFAENVSSHLQWEIDIRSIVGDEVSAQAKTWHDFTRQLEATAAALQAAQDALLSAEAQLEA